MADTARRILCDICKESYVKKDIETILIYRKPLCVCYKCMQEGRDKVKVYEINQMTKRKTIGEA